MQVFKSQFLRKWFFWFLAVFYLFSPHLFHLSDSGNNGFLTERNSMTLHCSKDSFSFDFSLLFFPFLSCYIIWVERVDVKFLSIVIRIILSKLSFYLIFLSFKFGHNLFSNHYIYIFLKWSMSLHYVLQKLFKIRNNFRLQMYIF